MSSEEKVALVYALAYAVVVLGLGAVISWRVAARPNKSFRTLLPALAVGFALVVVVGLVVAQHYIGIARAEG